MSDASNVPATVPPLIPQPPPTGWAYASFGARALAFTIDQFILIGIVIVVLLPASILLGLGQMMAWPFSGFLITPPASMVVTLVAWIYFALQESGRHQGTFGKRVCGLYVVDVNGHRVSFARASGRFFAKFISYAIMLVGFFMAAFTERHQALHDMLAETLVVTRVASPTSKN